MGDIIHLLPENVANQIAAGEVVECPGAVVKELVENSIDAGATDVKLVVRAAGKNLIQVIDNGKGMSRTDAITAFERHATSKISSAEDLAALYTMGFRGEALASIASVAQVELVTRREEDEIGTKVNINGGNIEKVESVACNVGANFAVKNVFYNLTARRKFMKTDKTEFEKIEQCFYNIALVYPNISFTLYHNDKLIYSLPASNLKSRISGIFSQKVAQSLMHLSADASIVKIEGYIGKPESARKKNDRQYFFVNGRYMDGGYFRKAVLQAYDRLIPPGMFPDYFIYLTVDPSTIDVNVSPTKTKVKFENDSQIFPILTSAVKEALGKFNVTASMDFEVDVNSPEMAFNDSKDLEISFPDLKIDPTYNPFFSNPTEFGVQNDSRKDRSWEQMQRSKGIDAFESGEGFISDMGFDFLSSANVMENGISFSSIPNYIDEALLPTSQPVNIFGRYIQYITSDGVLLIDQNRAHRRVLYEKYKKEIEDKKASTQLSMLNETLTLTVSQASIIDELLPDLHSVGYELRCIGQGIYSIDGVPSNISENTNHASQLTALIEAIQNGEYTQVLEQSEIVALALSKSSAVPYGKRLSEMEMKDLTGKLFLSRAYSITPEGKKTYVLLSESDFKKHFE